MKPGIQMPPPDLEARGDYAQQDQDQCGPQGCLGDSPECGPGERDPGAWSFVGEGRGGYEKVETLVWVGEGNGTYDKEELQKPPRAAGGNNRRSGCYIGVMIGLLSLGAVCLVSSLVSGPQVFPEADSLNGPVEMRTRGPGTAADATTQSLGPHMTTPVPQFRCEETEAPTWAKEQQVYCCAVRGVGCPELDCEAGYNNWHKGWSPGKKVWCCKHKQRGCEAGVSVPMASVPPTPAGGLATGGIAAAPAFASTTRATFDCSAGLQNWAKAWSATKKDFCCWRMGAGCPGQAADASPPLSSATPAGTPAPGMTFNCLTKEAWSAVKRDWCCHSKGLGCTPSTSLDPAPAAAAVPAPPQPATPAQAAVQPAAPPQASTPAPPPVG